MYETIAARLDSWCGSLHLTRLVVGYSGGLDSTVMLHLAWRYCQQNPHIQLEAVHINHGLQDCAAQWQAHCTKQADTLSVPLQQVCVSIMAKPRASLEAQAREARYTALADMIDTGSALLTGHHLDDQAETFLLALKRGSGVKGLSAMTTEKAFARGWLLRPLLAFSREQLEQYASDHLLDWIDDDSNLDQGFDRNYLRHSVLPQLNQRWPGISSTIVRSARHCADAQSLLSQLAELDLAGESANCDSLPLGLFESLSPSRRNNLLRYWLDIQGAPMPGEQHLQQIWLSVAASREDAQAVVAWQGWEVRRFRDRLYLLQALPELVESEIAVSQLNEVIETRDGRRYILTTTTEGERIRLPNDMPVTIRYAVTGLSFHPHNRNHSRALKKLWQEWRVPPWQRGRVPLLFYAEELVAVCGYAVARAWQADGNEPGLQLIQQ